MRIQAFKVMLRNVSLDFDMKTSLAGIFSNVNVERAPKKHSK